MAFSLNLIGGISIHALREEGDVYDPDGFGQSDISIHALREEGDTGATAYNWKLAYFYPRPPRGGRPPGDSFFARPRNFYPRPPRGGRLIKTCLNAWNLTFLSTPSARRATSAAVRLQRDGVISIHALREEGDRRKTLWLAKQAAFLSTPSARRATFGSLRLNVCSEISIHALREEGDKERKFHA